MANVGAQIVNPLDPNSIAQQQQLNRRQAYVDMLRQQSFEPVPQDPKGKFSTWAGLAQALRPLMASYAQGKNDNRQLDLNRGAMQANALRFGLGGQPAPAPSAAPPPPAMGAGGAPMSAPPAMGAPNAAPMPPQAAPEPQQAAPAPQGRNAFVPIGMDAETAYNMSLTNPEAYGAALTESNKPTDASKMLVAAGLQEGTPEYAAALQAIVKKQGFIEPTAIREGGYAIANDGSGRTWSAPKTEVGMQNIRDANGQVIGQENVPGAVEAIAASEKARALGKADATPISGVDADNNPAYTTAGTIARGVNGGGPLAAALGANGGAVRPSPTLGATTFADNASKASAAFFSGLADSAADAPNRVYALKQMMPLVNSKTAFGPGTEAATNFAGYLNGVGKAVGFQGSFNDKNVTNIAEFNKWAAQYSARAAQDLGLGGSDARLAMSVAATPNGHMTNEALKAIIPQMMGFEAAKSGMANAGAAYAAQHPGPNAQAQFLKEWRAAYEPHVYQLLSLPPEDRAARINAMPPAQRAELARKTKALQALGAL